VPTSKIKGVTVFTVPLFYGGYQFAAVSHKQKDPDRINRRIDFISAECLSVPVT